jgi:hypothetical protein
MSLWLRDGKSFSGGVHTAESLAGTAAAFQRVHVVESFILRILNCWQMLIASGLPVMGKLCLAISSPVGSHAEGPRMVVAAD